MDIRFMLYFVVPLSLGIIITLVGVILLFADYRKKPKVEEDEEVDIEDWATTSVGTSFLLLPRDDEEVDIEDWATTGGIVTSAHLGEQQSDDTYEPMIEYVYTVNAAEYHGDHIFAGKNISSKKEAAQEVLDSHPVNMYVPVRYNPQNPAESALEAQPHPMNSTALTGWVLSGFGVLSCCFTAFMTLVIFGAAQ